MEPTPFDHFITRHDNSAASIAQRQGRQAHPYRDFPSREDYTVTELYERPDGSRYEVKTLVHTWSGSKSYGPRERFELDALQLNSSRRDWP